jgi:RNA polymerase sigma-B factor
MSGGDAAADDHPGSPMLHLELPADPVAPQAVRRALGAMIADIRALERTDLLVLTSELISAMVGPGGREIEFDAWLTPHGFRIEVHGESSIDQLDPLTESLLDAIASDWFVEGGRAWFEIDASRVPGSAEAEEVLFARLAAGDIEARDELASRYKGFARSLARRFQHAGVPRDDLVQVASMGLVKALERFDPRRGVKFTTFAGRTIRGELKRHLRDSGWSLRVPRGLQELGLQATRVAAEFAQREGREPTLEEVSASVEEDPAEVADALVARRAFTVASLDAPSPDAEAFTLADTIPAHDERLLTAPEWADLSNVIDVLAPRERRVLYLRFFEDLSQSEIAARIGVSQMHISRLLARSIDELRAMIDPDLNSPGDDG